MKKLMLLVSLLTLPLLAQAHKAHTHGAGSVEVAMEVDKLEIDLEISGDAIVGFETKPNGEAQTKVALEAETKLKTLDKVVKINGGDCTLKDHQVKVEYDKNHSDYDIGLEFSCKKPLEVASLDFTVMDAFKGIKELSVSFVSKTKQDQKVLKGSQRIFNIK
jgi:hypothetical protein